MDKRIKREINQLKKEKRYEEIFEKYGSDYYKRFVPKWYYNEDLRKLKKEGRYEDIFVKYGHDEYKKTLEKAKYEEIKESQGKGKAFLYRLGCILRHVGITSTLYLAAASSIPIVATQQMINMNSVEYADEIEKNNARIKDYAEEIKQMNFTKLQILMKVTDDMWNSIEGYKIPSKDVFGFYELDLSAEGGYGVCRNFATDIAKKLNEIDDSFNARTINVYLQEGRIKMADINRKNLEKTQPSIEENEEKNKSEETKDEETESEEKKSDNEIKKSKFDEFLDDVADDVLGNHMVTLIDISEDDVTLVLDPTNPAIGVYMDGKITLLNPGDATMDAKEYGTAISHGGIGGVIDSSKGFIASFKKPRLTYDELVKKYGIEAQNKALRQVKAMATVKNTIDQEKEEFSKRIAVKKLENNIISNASNNSRVKEDVEK